jgi:L-2,4-diaminobutyric acid acetyltransferase
MSQKVLETRTGLPELTVRPPVLADAHAMHSLAFRCGLDLNSGYSYLMVCQYFHATSAVASVEGRVAGFISGFRIPASPSELFVWQIAVSPGMRGRGMASRMLDGLVERLADTGVTYVQATINPSNAASISTFSSLAERLGCEISNSVLFRSDQIPGSGHEEEVLYRVGPFVAPGAEAK